MVRLNRIYTRTGDDGSTGLVDGSRVSKASHRPVVMGSVDEANAAIGVARLQCADDADVDAMLSRIQNDLFDLGENLSSVGDKEVILYIKIDAMLSIVHSTAGGGGRVMATL